MMGIMVPEHVEQAIRSAIKTHLLHLVGILFPHIIDDARSKSHRIQEVERFVTGCKHLSNHVWSSVYNQLLHRKIEQLHMKLSEDGADVRRNM
jgi:hypothetical protein